ncbi:MAG TPA: acetylxylan esterase, partial [Planctomycetaceae bacterium]
IDPDKHDFTDGLHACLDYEDVPERSRPGTIAAWAWGLHRAVDYLTTDPDVDPQRICLTGHSRRGKTALFAAAMDERVALVVPHQSGTGGMALSRNNDQETVERINRVFPHWFADEFTSFDGREDRLPVDQHLLTALVAPRPLLETAGLEDVWANYESALRNLRAADPVYELLGKRGLVGDGVLTGDDEMTRDNTGELLQYRLDTKHEFNRDYWRGILDFADLHLGRETR